MTERELEPKILVGVRDGRVVLTRTVIPASLINLSPEKIGEEEKEFYARSRFRRTMLEEQFPNVTITIETPDSAKSLEESLSSKAQSGQVASIARQ